MEKRKELFSKIAYCCFYAGVVIEVSLVLIDKSEFVNPIEGRIFQLTFLLFTAKALLTKYSWKEYVTIGLFLALGAVSYFVTGRNEIIRFVMFIAACKDIDMQRCLKLVFWMTLSGCAVIILLSITGIYGAVSLTMEYGRGGVETRYTLGMGHPNALQCMVWALTVLGLYLYGEKMRWYGYLTILAINFLSFLLTDSKTSLIVTVGSILMSVIVCRTKLDAVAKLTGLMGMAASLLSIWISVVFAGNAHQLFAHYMYNHFTRESQFWAKVNEFLNGRLRILVATNGFQGAISTWHLFSNRESNYYFDLGWVRMFYWYGTIPACVFILVLIFLLIYCYRKHNYMAIVLITSFSVYSIIEAHAVSVYLARNYVLFLVGMYWSNMVKLIPEKHSGKYDKYRDDK